MSTLLIAPQTETITTSKIANDVQPILITDKDKALIIAQYLKDKKTKSELNKANQSELTKNRNEFNKDVKATLLNFDDVFNTTIKKKFDFLTSRPTLSKVNDNLDMCIEILFTLCSDSFALSYMDDKKVIAWGRLPRLITDKKLLFTFATTLQKSNSKCWSATTVIDLLFKALTVKDKDYEIGLKVRK